ncbi:MAG TPA: hypothetical protein VGM90_20080 [Kofleriaceae bacterium]|jgi:hypothetical protein
MNKKLLLCVGLVAASVSTASAETKSWTAIKGKMPANPMVALSVDVSALRSGIKAFDTTINTLVESEGDVKQAVGLIKQICSIDATKAISDISAGLDKDGKGIVALGLDGLDEKKLVDCANKILAQDKAGAKVSSKVTKGVTEYDFAGQGKIYAAWLGGSVVAISTDPEHREGLDVALKGKAATGDLDKLIKTASANTAWAVGIPGEKEVKQGWGGVTLAAGKVTGTVHIIPGDAKHGADMLAQVKTQLPQGIAEMEKSGAKNLAKALKGLKVGGTAAEITFDGSMGADDFGAVIPEAMQLMK